MTTYISSLRKADDLDEATDDERDDVQAGPSTGCTFLKDPFLEETVLEENLNQTLKDKFSLK